MAKIGEIKIVSSNFNYHILFVDACIECIIFISVFQRFFILRIGYVVNEHNCDPIASGVLKRIYFFELFLQFISSQFIKT